jgi:hypothetical protein
MNFIARRHATKHSSAEQVMINIVRRSDAVDIEMPTPVNIATYATTHMGHFGSSARVTVGKNHCEAPSARRTKPD